MNHLLCILNDPATAEAVLDASQKLARRLWLDVRIVHPRPAQDPDFMPTEEVMTERRRADFEAQQDALMGALTAIASRRQGSSGHLTIDDIRGDPKEIVASAAAGAALVVAGAALGNQRVAAAACIKDLLATGHGVIVVQPKSITSIGAQPAIAWKPGQPADDAVRTAMPILQAADRVLILIGLEEGEECEEPLALEQELAERGIVSSIVPVRFGDRHRGRALLAAVEGTGCDLLIAGTHLGRWLHDLLLGSVSKDLLADSHVPVLLHA